ncbi:hypothetical protein QNI16_19570 [Cytophagaceae bacterium YF14B1]|uniref:DUF2262 domain-containing protein n=1 Tax=Xanthocytophaga flava TaxID=3048013 RepID=A0AAE3QTT9_9BACT|nr:hypothetical protein [Xanthocytophaga flavus]MDJ1482709.1 hypothetical protein [Xanthocytophaga flavus]
MNKEEILQQITWDSYGIGKITLFVPLFGQSLPFVFFVENADSPTLTDKMVACVEDILALKPEDILRVKELLWEECLFAFQVADYGVDILDGETVLQAHLREFEVANAEDAYQKSEVEEIHISHENEVFKGQYAEIKINTASDNYISVIVKNGQIIDFDDDGTYLGWFDQDEQDAHKKRKKTLGD